jgi:hypothetical protein
MRFGSWVTSTTRAGPAVLIVALLGWQADALASNVFFSGRAIGAVGTVKAGTVNASIVLADNQMSCNGVPQEETVASVNNPSPIKLVSQTVATYTLGRDNTSTSTASIQNLNLGIPDLNIKVSAIATNAQVHCDFVPTHSTPSGLRAKYTVTGGSDIGTVSINGEGTAITGEANQTIEVPGVATIIFNEQIRSSHSIIVSGVHIKLLDESYPANGDIVLAYSRAKITCEP